MVTAAASRPPWTVIEHLVQDASGQTVGWRRDANSGGAHTLSAWQLIASAAAGVKSYRDI
jgi:hypothetical protein